MPIRYFLTIMMTLCVVACGQKGALYLEKPEKTVKNTKNTAIFTAKTQAKIVPDLVKTQTVTVMGHLAQINAGNVPSWQAVMNSDNDNTNLVHYVIFEDKALSEKTPIVLLKGTVQNTQKILTNADKKKVLTGGDYLRFRAIETGSQYIPVLIAEAKNYLQKETALAPRNDAPDFLIENQQAIDLYIAVERVK